MAGGGRAGRDGLWWGVPLVLIGAASLGWPSLRRLAVLAHRQAVAWFPAEAGVRLDRAGRARIQGVALVAEDRGPLAGATVELRGWPRSDAAVAAHRGCLRWQDPEPVTTGPDGSFRIQVQHLPPLGWDLVVRAPGRAARHRRWGDLTRAVEQRPLEILLPREVPVELIAVTRGGVPAAGALLAIADGSVPPRPGAASAFRTAQSDAGGVLRFPAVAAGTHRVVAAPESPWRLAGAKQIEVRSEGTVAAERVVVARPKNRLAGRLRDDQGAILAAVELSAVAGDVEVGQARTDAEGRFVVTQHVGADTDAPLRLVTASCGIELVPAPRWNEPARDFVAVRPGIVHLCVVDGEDRPVDRYWVQWLGGGRPERAGSLGGHHPQGKAFLGVIPSGTTWVDVVPGDDDVGRAGIVAIEVAPGSEQTVTVRLPSSLHRVVRVKDQAGEPLADTLVQVGVIPDGVEKQAPFVHEQARRVQAGREAAPWLFTRGTTDSSGEFRFRLPAAVGRYEIAAKKAGRVPALVAHVVDPTECDGAIDVVLPRGTTARGKVVPADYARHFARLRGERASPRSLVERLLGTEEELRIQAVPEPPPNWLGARALPATLTRGFAALAGQEAAVSDVGTVVLRGLAPGRYRLRLCSADAILDSGSAIDVSGDDFDFVLDVAALVPGSLVGRLSIDGMPARGLQVRAVGMRSRSPVAVTDDAGCFVLDGVLPGPVRLFSGKTFDPRPVEVFPGQRTVAEFSLVHHRVRVRVGDATGKPVAATEFWLSALCEETAETLGIVRTDEDGWCDLAGVGAGTFRLRPVGADGTRREATFEVPVSTSRQLAFPSCAPREDSRLLQRKVVLRPAAPPGGIR